jgi:fumigallin biosynthesis monooxygenase-like protein
MAKVIADRMTAQVESDFVVFLIGMRINRFWKLHKWLPVARAMPRRLRELQQDPTSG